MGWNNTLSFLGTEMPPNPPVVNTTGRIRLFAKVDNMLEKGLSTEQVYNSIARKGAGTVSKVISGPKLVDNRKLSLKAKETSTCSSGKKKFKS